MTRGLLLDAGGVLIGPVGGRWNPRYDFEQVLERPAAGLPVEPFPEVRSVLARLHAAGVPMAVVSDAWPDLEDLFRRLDLRRYFVTLVISAELGCRKPDPCMYRAGSDALGEERAPGTPWIGSLADLPPVQ